MFSGALEGARLSCLLCLWLKQIFPYRFRVSESTCEKEPQSAWLFIEHGGGAQHFNPRDGGKKVK